MRRGNASPIPLAVCIVLAALPLLSCGKGGAEIFKREDLFSLRLGKMEDHLSFFLLENRYGGGLIDFVMKDGLFFISNQDSCKVMKFNSYGDILSLIYNTEKNPVPVVLKGMDEDTIANRRAFGYQFLKPGHVAVGRDNVLLVQDEVPKERSIQDENGQSIFDQVVLRFDADGTLTDYLGQEGIGGTPFPYIERIQVNAAGDIIVTARTVTMWIVFWYGMDGQPKFRINVDKSALPAPKAGQKLMPSLETLFADTLESRLYIKIDYYADATDPSSKYRYGVQFHSSYLYTFDIESETYLSGFEIPMVYKNPEGLAVIEDKKERAVTEFVGAAGGGFLFMISPVGSSQYRLLILDRRGRVEESAYLQIKDDEQLFRKFYLDPSGILCAMLCEETGAKMVWWRTDELISRAREKQKTER